MDQIEFEVIRENTRVLTLRRIEADTQKLNQYPYRVVTEDPDRIGLCHVFGGSLFIRGFQKAPAAAREMMKRILLEQFEADTWQYEEEISAMIEQLRIAYVGIDKGQERHHTCHEPLQSCEANVLRAAPDDALIVSTLYSPWQIGLLIATSQSLTRPDLLDAST